MDNLAIVFQSKITAIKHCAKEIKSRDTCDILRHRNCRIQQNNSKLVLDCQKALNELRSLHNPGMKAIKVMK